jgi:hypothetical protein
MPQGTWYRGRTGSLRHLRKLTVDHLGDPPDWQGASLTVTYTSGEGIAVESSPPNELAELHKNVIESYRKARGLEGEALVLFFCYGKSDRERLKLEIGKQA